MKIENQKLIDKRDSLIRLAEKVGVDCDTIPFMYPRIPFDRTLTYEVALEALKLDMSPEHQTRLNDICNIPFNRDNRSAAEYAIDLIYGWFAEDIIIEFLLAEGFDVIRTGVDREREFLSSGRIKSDLDIMVTYKGNARYFDIYFDSSNYWDKTDKIDIRESKWNMIIKEDSSVICVSNAGFGIIDATSKYTLGPNPLWGGKNCATVKGIKSQLTNVDKFIIELKKKIKRK
jgi:hypothetical protein